MAEHAAGRTTAVRPLTLSDVGDRAVAKALREGPFAQALQAAVARSGLGLERIRHRLRQRDVSVGVTTLSSWQRGRCRPERPESLRAVRVLEEVLLLPPDSLVSLLGPPRPRGRRTIDAPPALDLEAVWEDRIPLRRLLAAMGGDWYRDVEPVVAHDRFYIGADRAEYAVRTTIVVRAEVDHASRYLALLRADDPRCPPEPVAVAYGSIGRVEAHESTGWLAVEILLDRTLRAGEQTVLEIAMRCPPGGRPTVRCERRFRTAAREHVLQVHFDPAALPARCFRLTEDPRRGEELPIGSSHTAQAIAFDLDAGAHGITWEWERAASRDAETAASREPCPTG
ncbi:hypothetical protein F0L68_15840 [Solihabitans fulvus]|uniref:Uncharacterized protein n=1 Tax=Solihabitans fulvus TaxID=1892852 RepID=A0A5B2XF17_9PSEU|nr:hypothetical protein [Solihabitans fulvus]KAA2261714.1 hypothetical protein F0L68_15840 [Solihabitans fulvus]